MKNFSKTERSCNLLNAELRHSVERDYTSPVHKQYTINIHKYCEGTAPFTRFLLSLGGCAHSNFLGKVGHSPELSDMVVKKQNIPA